MAYSERVKEAFELAFELHRDQTRKSTTTPYITHLMSVAGLVGEFGGSENQVIGALLHDAVEDQGGPAALALVRSRFGDEVAGFVAACSDTDVSPKPPWLERKKAFLREVASAAPDVKLIVAADKLHNVRSILADFRCIGDDVWARFNGGRDGSLWYHAEIVRSLAQDWPHPIVTELAHAVDTLHRATGEPA